MAFVTPYLEELVQDLKHYVVVNSEEYPWLEVGDDAPSKYRKKPDLFIGHEAIVSYRTPCQHKDTNVTPMHKENYRYTFGKLIHWKLRSCIGTTIEAKQ